MYRMDKNENDTINPLVKYFVPPETAQYMLWGQTILVVFMLLIMFLSIGFLYIYSNFNSYQNNISVISNAALFGRDPQGMFETYIKNTQAESIATTMNNIQSETMDLDTTTYRLNDKANRLLNTVSVDVPKNYTETNNLGISIQKNIAQIRDTLSKVFGTFVLNNYMTDGAVKTIQAKGT